MVSKIHQLFDSDFWNPHQTQRPSLFRYACAELDVKLEFSVFLFNWSDKLVVTDIDGTITQSDIKVNVTLVLNTKLNVFHK